MKKSLLLLICTYTTLSFAQINDPCSVYLDKKIVNHNYRVAEYIENESKERLTKHLKKKKYNIVSDASTAAYVLTDLRTYENYFQTRGNEGYVIIVPGLYTTHIHLNNQITGETIKGYGENKPLLGQASEEKAVRNAFKDIPECPSTIQKHNNKQTTLATPIMCYTDNVDFMTDLKIRFFEYKVGNYVGFGTSKTSAQNEYYKQCMNTESNFSNEGGSGQPYCENKMESLKCSTQKWACSMIYTQMMSKAISNAVDKEISWSGEGPTRDEALISAAFNRYNRIFTTQELNSSPHLHSYTKCIKRF